jgi:hypothetical protein
MPLLDSFSNGSPQTGLAVDHAAIGAHGSPLRRGHTHMSGCTAARILLLRFNKYLLPDPMPFAYYRLGSRKRELPWLNFMRSNVHVLMFHILRSLVVEKTSDAAGPADKPVWSRLE